MNNPGGELRSEGLSPGAIEKIKKFVLGGLIQPLPDAFQSVEIGRITIMMFYIGAYKIVFPDKPISSVIDVDKTIEYILTSLSVTGMGDQQKFLGFSGCEMFGDYQHGHISYTYAALASLSMLGYDLRRIDRKRIVNSLWTLFKNGHDGVFATSVPEENENDVRFVYSLCATCYLLNDWGDVDKERLFNFIMNSRSYDYAFAQIPDEEGHGGSTFCAVQSLAMLGMLDRLTHIDRLVQWLIQRSYLGLSGRINKPADTCYNFWIGNTLKTLGYEHLLDKKFILAFTENCVSSKYGGVSKMAGCHPDIMHTFCSLTGLVSIGALEVPFSVDPKVGFEKPTYLN
ncbi:Geranylgeranyl transferase type-1 subunit beta [Entamoeba marina]